MPRRPRVHLDGLPLHIVQRGHNRQPCFFCEADYQRYLHWLEEALAQARCELHAYVLMTNHVHLLVTPQAAQRVPGVLISLGRRYVQRCESHLSTNRHTVGQSIPIVAGAVGPSLGFV